MATFDPSVLLHENLSFEQSRKNQKWNQKEKKLSWYSNRVWLNFNNFSTFSSLTFFCLLDSRHSTRDMPWLQLIRTMCEVDPCRDPVATSKNWQLLPSHHAQFRPCSGFCLCCCVLIAACDVDGCCWLSEAWFVCHRKQKVCKTCCMSQTERKNMLKRYATTCCNTATLPLCHTATINWVNTSVHANFHTA